MLSRLGVSLDKKLACFEVEPPPVFFFRLLLDGVRTVLFPVKVIRAEVVAKARWDASHFTAFSIVIIVTAAVLFSRFPRVICVYPGKGWAEINLFKHFEEACAGSCCGGAIVSTPFALPSRFAARFSSPSAPCHGLV